MGYRHRPYGERLDVLGDIAEEVYGRVEPFGKSQRIGWRRPAVTMRNMSDFLKHTPDFYAETGHLVEVMGCGGDNILKLKRSKWDALTTWQKIQGRVVFFVWNSKAKVWCAVPFSVMRRHINRIKKAGGEQAFENDGNVYYPISWTDLIQDNGTTTGLDDATS